MSDWERMHQRAPQFSQSTGSLTGRGHPEFRYDTSRFDERQLDSRFASGHSDINRPINPAETESRFAGLVVGIGSVFAEHVLSHPFIVLRRQCQVHHSTRWYHTTPFTLFQVIFNIQRHQTVGALWKGIGSTLMVKGIGVASETIVSEVTPFPKEVNRHTSIKKLMEHLVLKGIAITVTAPFYASSLVETVQSDIASERPGVFDCLREGMSRLLGWGAPQSSRLLPIYKIIGPMLLHGLCHYLVSSIAKYTVLASVQSEINERKQHLRVDEAARPSLAESYYPELVATFTGGLLADVLLYPMETVLHRLCLQGTRTIIDDTDTGLGVVPIITRYRGMLDCIRGIVSEEGLGGLYKGFGALILQYMLHMALLKLTKMLFDLLSKEAPPPAPTLAHTLRPGPSREPVDFFTRQEGLLQQSSRNF